jgi:hypothetical protein
MTTVHDLSSDPERPLDRSEVKDQLERGELVSLLAKARAGRLSATELEEVLARRHSQQWIRQFFAALLNR